MKDGVIIAAIAGTSAVVILAMAAFVGMQRSYDAREVLKTCVAHHTPTDCRHLTEPDE